MHYSWFGLEAVRQLVIHHSRATKKKKETEQCKRLGETKGMKTKGKGHSLQMQRTNCCVMFGLTL